MLVYSERLTAPLSYWVIGFVVGVSTVTAVGFYLGPLVAVFAGLVATAGRPQLRRDGSLERERRRLRERFGASAFHQASTSAKRFSGVRRASSVSRTSASSSGVVSATVLLGSSLSCFWPWLSCRTGSARPG